MYTFRCPSSTPLDFVKARAAIQRPEEQEEVQTTSHAEKNHNHMLSTEHSTWHSYIYVHVDHRLFAIWAYGANLSFAVRLIISTARIAP